MTTKTPHKVDYKQLSIDTIFGECVGLERISERLERNGISFFHQLEHLTENEFWRLCPRTTPSNKAKFNELFSVFPPDFHQ